MLLRMVADAVRSFETWADVFRFKNAFERSANPTFTAYFDNRQVVYCKRSNDLFTTFRTLVVYK